MKQLFFFIFIFAFVSCRQPDALEIEKGIYLTKFNIGTPLKVDQEDTIAFFTPPIETISATANTYFSKKFWVFLFKNYPKTAALMFNKKDLRYWGKVEFYSSAGNENIDLSKTYLVRAFPSWERSGIDSLLPASAYQNEAGQPSGGLNTRVINDYLNFKSIFHDSTNTTVEIICDKAILTKILDGTYTVMPN